MTKGAHSLHDRYLSIMKLVDHFFRRDTDSANKQGCLILYDNVCQFGQLSLRIIVLKNS